MSTPIADMVEQMLSADIPPDKILFAIRAVEQTTGHSRYTDPAAAKRRAWDREYQARRRAKHPPDSPPDAENALSLTSSTSNLPTEDKKRKKERKTGFVCPPDFHPTEEHYTAGVKVGLARANVDALCEDMKNWSAANENRAVARKTNWGAALFSWIRREKGNTKTENTSGNIIPAAQRLLERVRQFDRPVPAIDSGIRDDARIVPFRTVSEG